MLVFLWSVTAGARLSGSGWVEVACVLCEVALFSAEAPPTGGTGGNEGVVREASISVCISGLLGLLW